MPAPEKLQIANAGHRLRRNDRWTDRGNTTCPFHHSLNGGGIKMKTQLSLYLDSDD